MSDEGFHGGDLFTLSIESDNAVASSGNRPINRTPGRKTSISSLSWTSPDRILVTEVAGGSSAVSEIPLTRGAVDTLCTAGQDVHAFGNFRSFALAGHGTDSVVIRSSFEQAPEIWVGPAGSWVQVTHNNRAQVPAWGKAESMEWTNESFTVQGWMLSPK